MSVQTSRIYPHDTLLRARIQAFSPDEPGVVFPFSARLARENGWTRERALRVIEEYRRFVYLAMTAGHVVTPSKAVDEAWHLHLTYTRSYWDDLCGRVLGRPLHHDPSKGGAEEDAKYAGLYARTLESYRAAFGHEPPRDVWPAPAERSAPAAPPRPASAETRRTVRTPRFGRAIPIGSAVALLMVIGACAGIAEGDAAPWIVGGGVIAIVLAVVVGSARQPAFQQVRGRKPARKTAAGAAASDGGGGAPDVGGSHGCDAPGDGGSCGDGGGGGCGGGGCGGGGCGGG